MNNGPSIDGKLTRETHFYMLYENGKLTGTTTKAVYVIMSTWKKAL